jgi:hypothetical protein
VRRRSLSSDKKKSEVIKENSEEIFLGFIFKFVSGFVAFQLVQLADVSAFQLHSFR